MSPLPVRPPSCELPRAHTARAVEREHEKAGRITKRGDVYLRTLLVHGARSVLARAKQKVDPTRRDRLREWAAKVEKARGHNKAAVALANKMARMVWAVWRHDRDYQPTPVLPNVEEEFPPRAATRSSDG